MKENKMLKTLTKLAERTAYSQAKIPSRWYSHQPKTPTKLLEKKAK